MTAIKTTAALGLAVAMGVLGACAASAASGMPRAAAMPSYYATAAAQGSSTLVTVHSARNGAATGRVVVPAGPLDVTVSAAPDDRSFMAGGAVGTAYRLFRVAVSAAGAPSRPVPVSGFSIPLGGGPGGRVSVVGAALSPDGTRLAISLKRLAMSVDTFSPSAAIEVVDLANVRDTNVWDSAAVGYWAGPPSWTGPSTVAYAWWHVTSIVFPRVAQHVIGIGTIKMVGGGPSIRAGMRPLSSALGIRSVAFAPGNPLGIAAACVNQPVGGGGHGVVIARIGQIGLTTGQFRILTSQAAPYRDPGTESTLLAACGALVAMDPSGHHALVYGDGFGRMDNGAFTALPALPAPGSEASAAW